MEKHMKLLFSLYSFCLFFTLFSAGNLAVECSPYHHHSHNHGRLPPRKLFVFGDSYADTGNRNKSSSSWMVPYGLTFPGVPAGRFSNGRVFTDFLASHIGIKSPIPYRYRKVRKSLLRNGMNFAYGGTGVFKTMISDPNMTTQIDFLQDIVKAGIYTKYDLHFSVAYISLAGNDYNAYLARNGTPQDLPAFMTSVVNQLALNVKRIHGMGIRKIAVSALGPLGCLPQNTATSSHQQCNETFNIAANFHNSLLQNAMEELKNQTGGNTDSEFVILDLYSAFMAAIKSHGNKPGSMRFESPLEPCCKGASDGYDCGSVEHRSGIRMYVICGNPEKAFFWDTVHPTQQGWHSVYLALKPSLDHLLHSTIR